MGAGPSGVYPGGTTAGMSPVYRGASAMGQTPAYQGGLQGMGDGLNYPGGTAGGPRQPKDGDGDSDGDPPFNS